MNLRIGEYLRGLRLSTVRLLMLGAVVGSVFLVDYMLKGDVSGQLSDAWNEACIKQVSVAACLARIEQFHDQCFTEAYSSMLMRFGQGRWKALNIDTYELCMETGNPDPSDPSVGLFRQNPE